jgi:hypothetical protein
VLQPFGLASFEAAKTYNAAASTGEGQSSVQFTLKVAVPASAPTRRAGPPTNRQLDGTPMWQPLGARVASTGLGL